MSERLAASLADRYRIERELGAGGMATVYLAHDVKHDRDVAIKVLHPDLGAALGGERFLTEIRTTARLQHPHILPLLDSGAADGLLYYVMPLVTGETLRARLDREKQLPIDDALLIAREVADALGYAHGLGVIHRDIKPENILLQNGHALVADFGIALAVQSAGGQRMTQTGLSLGTPQYMSPEQAMGEKTLDARSDLYALGAVVYEMLTGEPPFTGPTVQAIVAKVLSSEPEPIATIRKAVPPHVAAAVHTAIEKLSADRYASAAAFVQALNDTGTSRLSSRSGAHVSGRTATRWRTLALATSAACVVAVAAVGWMATRPTPPSGPTEYDVVLPDSAAMSLATPFAVSPTGDFVVYPAAADPTAADPSRTTLWYRSLLDGTSRRVTDDAPAFAPAIAPDGQSLAYVATRATSSGGQPGSGGTAGLSIERIPMAGGKPTVLARAKTISHLFWKDAQHLVSIEDIGRSARIVDADAGVSVLRSIGYCELSSPLPDPGTLMCGGGSNRMAARVEMQADTTKPVEGFFFRRESDSSLVYGSQFTVIDERYVVYANQQGDLQAARVDLVKRTIGRPVRMLSGLSLRDYSAAASYRIADNGTLVYAVGANHAVGQLVRQNAQSIDTLPVGRAAFQLWRMSPDGKRLAATVEVLEGQELRVYDLQTGRFDVLASAPNIRQPLWSPTGDRLVYALWTRDRTLELYLRPLNASEAPPPLVRGGSFEPNDWLPDGRVTLSDWATKVVAMNVEQRSTTTTTLVTDALYGAVSPDGKWIAYSQPDENAMWLEPLPRTGKRYPLHSGSNADDPHWLSATELVFKSYEPWGFDRVTITASAENPVGPMRRWFNSTRALDTPGASSQLSVDGRVIYLQADIEAPVRSLRVVPNWVAKMKQAVDAVNK
ncbi:MAG: protein kinase [Gemmatimonadaceae bacterium]|nr:protein kinase [Gemmatimonadaceae bacterium]